ncbi:Protein of unknown function [Cotesia congregata]|uniref:Uncharacterized protein n=1 Tax=Cotesia congregata TaxID=51543 RepID=A0A8J2MU17_COTCN|nr:Protein of unknown function [Cotesia congregata]
MSCAMCFTACDDNEHCIKASCHYHHRFHPGCLKLKYNFASSAEAVESIKTKCPVCSENDLMSTLSALKVHLSKLDKLDKLDGLQNSAGQLLKKVDKISDKHRELFKQYTDLETRVNQLEKNNSSGACSKNLADKRTLQMETLALADEMTISGLQEKDDEDFNNVLDNLFSTLGIPGDHSKVKSMRRIGKAADQQGARLTRATTVKNRNRDILVKFGSKDTVDLIINKSRSVANKRGGGVSLYIKNSLSSRFVLSSTYMPDRPEYLFMEIWHSSRQKILIGTVYNPPASQSLELLQADLDDIMPHYVHVILLGDLNIDMNAASANRKSNIFLELCGCLGLQLITYESTIT